MTEDFGIARYLKKRYQQEYFQPLEKMKADASAEMTPQKLAEVKAKYF